MYWAHLILHAEAKAANSIAAEHEVTRARQTVNIAQLWSNHSRYFCTES